jgi:tRNA 2-thiouridine synthesizing protein A
MIEVNACGLSCPEPIIQTRLALISLPAGETMSVLVDTVTSRENVRRFALGENCSVEVSETQDGFKLLITKS